MNKLVKRGFSAYKIFLRNKLAMSIMMLMGGIMLTIGAFSGNGNDTKTMPAMIAIAGGVFTLWAVYRIGYLKANLEKIKGDERETADRAFLLQIIESVIYLIITLVGLFLLLNESFTNRLLNIMTGGFTILNGVVGTINAIKNRANFKTFKWKFLFSLAVIELTLGTYFIFMPDDVNIVMLAIVGIITIIAGIIEVISACKRETFEKTIQDGKDILKVLKDDKEDD